MYLEVLLSICSDIQFKNDLGYIRTLLLLMSYACFSLLAQVAVKYTTAVMNMESCGIYIQEDVRDVILAETNHLSASLKELLKKKGFDRVQNSTRCIQRSVFRWLATIRQDYARINRLEQEHIRSPKHIFSSGSSVIQDWDNKKKINSKC